VGILSAIARDTDAGFVTKGATSLVDLIRKQFGDDIDGATQELVRMGGFPESVARRIATGELPMDEASRVARREAQSAPETYYHGTNKGDIKEINMSPDWRTNDQSRGFWVSDNPRTSNTYADDFRRGTLYPFRVKKGQTESYNYEGNAWGNPPEGVIGAGANTNDIARKAFDRGVDAVEFRDIVDVATSVDGDQDLARKYLKDILRDRHGPDYQFNPMDATTEDYGKASTMARRELLGESNNVVVGNDSLIRSPNAAFDPQYTGPNIMGGAAGTAALAGLLAAPEEAEAGFITRGGRGLLEAWHGSPHKFDKFSMDQIGTGEGAQAYGHGLYFADEIDVAKGYQPRDRDHEQWMYEQYKAAEEAGDQYMMDAWERAMMHDSPIELRASAADPDYDEYSQAAFAEVADALTANPGAGSLSRVEIDVTPESLLDWDKPLSEQSETVRNALDSLDPATRGFYKYDGEERTGRDFYWGLKAAMTRSEAESLGIPREDWWLGNDERASKMLRDRGIKGIKYLDGDSRAVGDGTSNYVIFDDSLINIAERGAADPRLLGGTALGTAGILGAIAAGDRDDTAMAASPRSDTLQDITMGLRGVERRLKGSPASLLFPEGVVNYLETVNRPYEDPTVLTRVMGLLDFL